MSSECEPTAMVEGTEATSSNDTTKKPKIYYDYDRKNRVPVELRKSHVYLGPIVGPCEALLEQDYEQIVWKSDYPKPCPYQQDSVDRWRQLEKIHRPMHCYMRNQKYINHMNRYHLIDWMVELCILDKLDTATLHLSIWYVDRYLSRMTVTSVELKVMGAAALYIAFKYKGGKPVGNHNDEDDESDEMEENDFEDMEVDGSEVEDIESDEKEDDESDDKEENELEDMEYVELEDMEDVELEEKKDDEPEKEEAFDVEEQDSFESDDVKSVESEQGQSVQSDEEENKEKNNMTDLLFLNNDNYTQKDVLVQEKLMLKVLGNELCTPTACIFINAYAALVELPQKVMNLAIYIAELSMLDGRSYMRYPPSLISAAAVALARYTSNLDMWHLHLEKITSYSLPDLRKLICKLSHTHQTANVLAKQAVRVKYMAKQYLCVALIGAIDLTTAELDQLCTEYVTHPIERERMLFVCKLGEIQKKYWQLPKETNRSLMN